MRPDGWFVKLDVQGYFPSIHHATLLGLLERLFKDRLLLRYFSELIAGHGGSSDGRGLPIGHLTSQYFANHYLAVADHYLMRSLRPPAAVRYMDDVLLLGDDKAELLRMAAAYQSHAEEKLRLQFHPPVANRQCFGIPFLGHVVYHDRLRLSQRTRRRFRTHLSMMQLAFREGRLDEEAYHCRLAALHAHVSHADSAAYVRRVLAGQGHLP